MVSSKKCCETRYESSIQVMASAPRFAPCGGRSAVRFHSFVAFSDVPAADGSKRRTLIRLTLLTALLRSVEMYIPPVELSPTKVTPSESGSPVPSG